MSSPADWIGKPQQQPMTYNELQQELELTQQDAEAFRQEADYYKKAMADDPWRSNPHRTPQEGFADRMLRQRVPQDQAPSSAELYMTRSDLLELLALIPSLSRKDYRRFVRDWEDIETLAQGGGNSQIVKSRQERLLFEIQLARSVGDAPVIGMTTTTALITNRMESDQKINMPPANRRPQGFLDGLMSYFGR